MAKCAGNRHRLSTRNVERDLSWGIERGGRAFFTTALEAPSGQIFFLHSLPKSPTLVFNFCSSGVQWERTLSNNTEQQANTHLLGGQIKVRRFPDNKQVAVFGAREHETDQAALVSARHWWSVVVSGVQWCPAEEKEEEGGEKRKTETETERKKGD